jgi:MoaA/NifB/PqqE/SkfB family radical SAM enzyme
VAHDHPLSQAEKSSDRFSGRYQDGSFESPAFLQKRLTFRVVSLGEAMKKSEVFQAWAGILSGRAPSLSIEITKECPLRCPGCYAFDAAHLGNATQLRQLSDFQGDELVTRILALLDELKPLHVSLVGGDPLVRYRELEQIIPQVEARGIHTQVVTSAFRVIPSHWKEYKRLNVVVSIDGLQPEHDERRKPATYDRILKNIVNARVTIHSTITSQVVSRRGYLEEFLTFWSENPAIRKIWFSLFTPQRGATNPEILSPTQRTAVISELRRLRPLYPKLDMHDIVINEIAMPPSSPKECIFARTTRTISADLITQITPCQFGGDPDCSQCGCIASMGLAAVGHYKVIGGLTAGHIFSASDRIGKRWQKLQRKLLRKPIAPTKPLSFKILSSSSQIQSSTAIEAIRAEDKAW